MRNLNYLQGFIISALSICTVKVLYRLFTNFQNGQVAGGSQVNIFKSKYHNFA